jgi:CRP-like cAMP-binding protein
MLFDDLVKAIRESPFFHGMPSNEQVSLARLGTVDVHPPGTVLFRPGEVPAALYLVLDGVVEVSREESAELGMRPVAYMSAGSTILESKVITGTTLTSLAHFPEGGVTLTWPRPVLLRQLYSSQDLALNYLQSLARRMEGTIVNLGANEGSNLGGRLEHFDLPAILQTVVDTGGAGVLEILDSEGLNYGAIHTKNNKIGRMHCGRLTGREAFLQIMAAPPKRGTFRFSSLADPQDDVSFQPLQPLLMEAARIQDEFAHFAVTVPSDAILQPSSRQLVWGGGNDSRLIEQIWHQLSVEPCGWGELAEVLPFSRGQVGLAVRDMLLAGVVNVDRTYETPNDGFRARGA